MNASSNPIPFRTLFAPVRGFWGKLLWAAFLDLLSRAPVFLLPWIWKWMVEILANRRGDAADADARLAELTVAGIVFSVAMALQVIFGQFRGVLGCRVGDQMAQRLRRRLWQSSARSFSPATEEGHTGHLMTLFLSDLGQLEAFYSQAIPGLISGTLVVTALCLCVAVIHWPILVVSILLSPLILVPGLFIGKRLRRETDVSQRAQSHTASTLQEGLVGMREIRSARAIEHWYERKIHTTFHDRFLTFLALARTSALHAGTSSLVFVIYSVGVVVYSGREVLLGNMSIPEWFALGYFCQGLASEGKTVFRQFFQLPATYSVAGRFFGYLAEREREITEQGVRDAKIDPGAPLLELREASFHYGSHVTLQGGSFTVREGSLIVLMGPSGTGKTTLAMLAAGFLPATGGAVLLGGKPIGPLPEETVREHVGIVLQDPSFFSGSLRENLLLGSEDYSDARILEVLEEVQGMSILQQLPQGLDSPVGERGLTLSIGERRRLALARCILRLPPLIILDEPLSGLDRENARVILTTLRRYANSHGILLITHDPIALDVADESYFLDNGILRRSTLEPATPGA